MNLYEELRQIAIAIDETAAERQPSSLTDWLDMTAGRIRRLSVHCKGRVLVKPKTSHIQPGHSATSVLLNIYHKPEEDGVALLQAQIDAEEGGATP